MDVSTSLAGTVPFRHPAEWLRGSDDLAARVIAATGDIALSIDAGGIVRDVALGSGELMVEGAEAWVGRAWADTVTSESRGKVADLLRDAPRAGAARWRQVNHSSPAGDLPIRYLALDTARDGGVIAIGRDMRAAAALQQRLLAAQQSMERDYVRLRQAEARYRLLFDASAEAVLIVDTATRRIAEANPAAHALIGAKVLAGQPLVALLGDGARDAALTLLGAVAAAEGHAPVRIELADGRAVDLAATLFRQDRATFFLVRLTSAEAAQATADDHRLVDVLDRLPDAFVLTGDGLAILAENAAFLDLAQVPRRAELRGAPLSRFLGRPGIDLGILVQQLRDHGAVRNFATIVRGAQGNEEEVEVSAVAAGDAAQPLFGFSLRARSRTRLEPGPALPRSVEQLTELVGRVPLKDIVRESTDLIERLCIEAALLHTRDNRASAAEILGLSRQSLYSKLHRHSLGNLSGGDDA